jgi:glutamyl-tRNA reductase
MARAIINKLLHEPTSRLRAAGSAPEGALLAGTVAALFGLEEPARLPP